MENLENHKRVHACRALDHPILGPKFGPIPNAKKYVFFPIPDKKFPILQKKKKKKKFFFFFFFFASPPFISYNINTEHIVTY